MNGRLQAGSANTIYLGARNGAGSLEPRSWHLAYSESPQMAAHSPLIKVAVRLGVAAFILATAPVATAPAFAASNQFQSGQHRGNGNDASPYNVDQDPCMPQGGRRHRQGQGQACPGQQFDQPQHVRGAQRPGSSAFGLQFNFED